ncbi:MAG: peptide-methionine (S)-S-oxide reductase [Candidatus Azotimanducaceae bacterium]|jgi:peptide-methionine (S)-S-oxide reductase
MGRVAIVLLSLMVFGCFAEPTSNSDAVNAEPMDYRTAVFAGGCFWCMEPPFDKLPGVISTVSGYAGGHLIAPTYRDVTGGRSGHLEVIQITYDPGKVSYEELLDVFWVNVDPVDGGGQFCDRGESYTTAIFTSTDREQKLAQESQVKVQQRLSQEIQTPIRPLKSPGFYPAEDYHQNYYQKNSIRYKFYRSSCGRDSRLKALWGNS